MTAREAERVSDPFPNVSDTIDSVAYRFAPVTPHDATMLADFPKALYVGTAGDVVVLPLYSDTAVTFKGVPAGTLLPIRCRRVNATGTAQAAGDIIALY